jgi:hypothetical protein
MDPKWPGYEVLNDYGAELLPVPKGVTSPKPIPKGLARCERCGRLKGWTQGVRIQCLCDGLVCAKCGNRKPRPISSDFNEVDRRVWHSPWFSYMVPCPDCGEHRWIQWKELEAWVLRHGSRR